MTDTPVTSNQQQSSYNATSLERYQSRQPTLYGWVKELHRAINSTDSKSLFWEAVGHSLIVADADADDLRTFLMTAAGAVEGQYFNLSIEQLLECSEMLVNETVPTVAFVEPDEWLIEREVSKELQALRRDVVTLLRAFYENNSPVVLVSHAPQLGSIAECFRHRYAFDRHIFWAAPKPELIAQDLFDVVGGQYLQADVLANPERLGRLLSLEFSSARRSGMLIAALRRRAILDDRLVGWRDLIDIAVNGTGEGFPANDFVNTQQTSVHEAGHALVNIVGSDFKSIPDMVTVAHGNGSAGVVVESYHHIYEKRGGNLSFRDICQRIRTCLAGRAAEELEYGMGGCGAFGSQSDLENASRMAMEMVLRNGFPADYENTKSSGSNLFALPEGHDYGDMKHIHAEARRFLEKLYHEAKEILNANREFFNELRQELIRERYLMKEDLEKLSLRWKS